MSGLGSNRRFCEVAGRDVVFAEGKKTSMLIV